MLKKVAAVDETIRVIGVNYFEDFEDQGSEDAVKKFVKESYPSLEVVRADTALWAEFGSPSKIPSMYVFDRNGTMIKSFVRSERPAPTRAELEAVLLTLE